MKDPEHHSITKAIKLLRIWLTRKKRLMVQAQDLQRQLADAWRDKDQLEAEVEETTLKLKDAQQANNNYAYVIDKLKAKNEELLREIKRVPNKLRWVSDNASHHSSSHWLKTQLYGLARELETGYMNVGTKEFYRVDALIGGDDATSKT